MKSIAIIHFQPIEKYPPITNLLDYLAKENTEQKVYVFTNNFPLGFKAYQPKNNKIIIKRCGNINSPSTIKRIANYLFFYLCTFFKLIVIKPSSVLYYETLSVLPAFLYKKIKKKLNLFIHYHEYTSTEEYQTNSAIVKWLHKQEQKLYKQATWISHTNKSRLEMFLKDESITYNKSKHQLMPNYPPKNWITKNSTTIANSDVTKFIYIGSLGLDTMYLKELAQFVISKEGKIILDIYTNQFNSEAVSYIKDLNTKHINILGSVAYDDIPFMIKNGNYQVGLIIYNGHIKNYIYNAPNKLFEYLACSLNVWYPHIMVGCQAYKNTTSFPLIFEVDFNNINTYYNQFMSISKNEIANTPSNFYYESVYTNIASVL